MFHSLIRFGSHQVGYGKIVFTIIKIVVCVAMQIHVAMIGIGVAAAVMIVAVVAASITADISKVGIIILLLALKEFSTTLPQQTLLIVSQLHL